MIKNIKYIFTAFLLFILVSVIALSFSRPLIGFDSWAYHFPFSAKMFQINNYSESFLLDKTLQIRYDGFPLLAEALQGLLWISSSSISATTLINSIPLIIFILCAAAYGGASFPILVFGILAIPLVAIHATSSYIDLFFGIGLAFQYLAAVIIFQILGDGLNKRRLLAWIGVYLLAAFWAGNTKMWGPIISLGISFFLFIAVIYTHRTHYTKKVFSKILYIVIITVVLTCGSFIKNLILYNNPIYPIAYNIPVLNLQLKGPEAEYKSYPGYAENYGLLRRPIYFFLSVTEFDWKIREIPAFYSLEMGIGDSPKKYLPARTGGWWGIYIVVSVSLTLIFFLLKKCIRLSRGHLAVFPITLFCFLTCMTAFMPQSHELRYFLYWPIILIFNLAYLVKGLNLVRLITVPAIFLYMEFFFYSLLYIRGETMDSLITYKNQQDLIGINPNASEIVSAKQLGGICLGPSYAPDQFKYSSIFQGGSYFIEQGWLSCHSFPEFKKIISH
jgi:hypothetical protein